MTADHDAAPTRLHHSAFWLLGRAAREAERATLARLTEAGLRRYYYGVLATLDEFGPSSQATIGRRLGIDPSDVVAVVNELEERGEVRRRRDPDDRRRNLVDLTARGSATLDGFDDAITVAEDEFLAGLTKRQRADLIATLTTLVL